MQAIPAMVDTPPQGMAMRLPENVTIVGAVEASQAGEIGARLDRLPATRSIWMTVARLSLAFFIEVYNLLLVGYVGPGLTKAGLLTVTTSDWFGLGGLAAFIASLFAGLSIGTVLAGFLADRLGRRTVILGAMAWFAFTSSVVALQGGPTGLEIWQFLTGLGLGVELVTLNTYISEFVSKNIRGRSFALSQTVGFSAVPILAVIAWFLVPREFMGLDGWRWVDLCGSALAVCTFVLLLRSPESPRWLAVSGRYSEADRIVTNLERRVEAESGAPLPPLDPLASVTLNASFAEILRRPYRARAIMLIIFNIFQTIGFYGFVNWVPSLLVQQGISVTKSLMYTMIIAFAAPVGPLIGVLFADLAERKYLVMGSSIAVAVCGLVFGFTRSVPLLITMGIVVTICQNVLSFSYHAYQTELFPTRIRGKAVGFVYSWSRVSAMFNAFAIALILRHFGANGVFVFIASAMIVVFVVIGLMGPRTTGLSLEEISN